MSHLGYNKGMEICVKLWQQKYCQSTKSERYLHDMVSRSIIIIIIIIIIIAFKCAIRNFLHNLLTAPRTVSNMYAQVAWAQSCADHVQHIERLSRASVMSCATWYEGTAQLLSLTELKSHLFELYLIG